MTRRVNPFVEKDKEKNFAPSRAALYELVI